MVCTRWQEEKKANKSLLDWLQSAQIFQALILSFNLFAYGLIGSYIMNEKKSKKNEILAAFDVSKSEKFEFMRKRIKIKHKFEYWLDWVFVILMLIQAIHSIVGMHHMSVMKEPKSGSFYFACLILSIITFIYSLPILLFPFGQLAIYLLMKYLFKSMNESNPPDNKHHKVRINYYTKYNTSYKFCPKQKKYDYSQPIMKESYKLNLKGAISHVVKTNTINTETNYFQQTDPDYDKFQTSISVTDSSDERQPTPSGFFHESLNLALKALVDDKYHNDSSNRNLIDSYNRDPNLSNKTHNI